jgi:hypothetical protein
VRSQKEKDGASPFDERIAARLADYSVCQKKKKKRNLHRQTDHPSLLTSQTSRWADASYFLPLPKDSVISWIRDADAIEVCCCCCCCCCRCFPATFSSGFIPHHDWNMPCPCAQSSICQCALDCCPNPLSLLQQQPLVWRRGYHMHGVASFLLALLCLS